MSKIQIDYDAVTATKTTLESGKKSIETTVATMQRLVEGLVTSGFETDLASVKFMDSFTEFEGHAKDILEGVGGLAEFLGGVVEAFSSSDSDLAASLRGE